MVFIYVRPPLSLRIVEDLLCERGIDICHENRPVHVEQVRSNVRWDRSRNETKKALGRGPAPSSPETVEARGA